MLAACKVALLLGTALGSGCQTGVAASDLGPTASGRPTFSLAAGDALGAQIRVNDEILARRLGVDRVQFATVPTPD